MFVRNNNSSWSVVSQLLMTRNSWFWDRKGNSGNSKFDKEKYFNPCGERVRALNSRLKAGHACLILCQKYYRMRYFWWFSNFYSITSWDSWVTKSVTVNLNFLFGCTSISSGVKYDSDSSGLYSFETEKLELGRIKRSKTPLLVAVAAIFRDGQLETNSGVHCLKRIFSWSLLPIPPALLPQANELWCNHPISNLVYKLYRQEL